MRRTAADCSDRRRSADGIGADAIEVGFRRVHTARHSYSMVVQASIEHFLFFPPPVFVSPIALAALPSLLFRAFLSMQGKRHLGDSAPAPPIAHRAPYLFDLAVNAS
jgi:hypothetical protein